MAVLTAPYIPSNCPLCGFPRGASHRLRAVWYEAPWDIDPHDRARQTRHEHWMPVCGQCASQAALFRLDFPRQLARQQRDTLRLVIALAACLFTLLMVMWSGRNIIHSDPSTWKDLYGAGWLVFGIAALFTIRLGWRVIQFELTTRASWSGPWLERRLAQFLALPQGDDKPFWWEVMVTEGLDSIPIVPPDEDDMLEGEVEVEPVAFPTITRNYIL